MRYSNLASKKKGELIVAYVEYFGECVASQFREKYKERDREERKNTSGNRIKSRAIDRNIKWGFTRGHK